MKARPLIKYPGSKKNLLPEILARLPAKISTFYDAFVGGASVAFGVLADGRAGRVSVSDKNEEIVDVLIAARDKPRALSAELRIHAFEHQKNPEKYFLEQRGIGPLFMQTFEIEKRAARTIYLSKTSYNGLYRHNLMGDFNASLGDYEDPTILDQDNINATHAALAAVEIRCLDFADATKDAKPGDAVYFDPPYIYPDGATNFIAYGTTRFRKADHVRLAAHAEELGRRGVYVLISNDDNPRVREIYGAFEISTVFSPRAINRDPNGRGPVPEILAVWEGGKK